MRRSDQLTKDVNYLQTKFTNLEAHSRRNNLVFFGRKAWRQAIQIWSIKYCYILDLEDAGLTPEVERQHHSLHPCLAPTDPLCPYIVRMFRWSDRQKIFGSVAKKRQLFWRGKPFQIYQDLPTEIKRKCAEYDDIRGKLWRAELDYGLLYPSRLIVTIGDI